MEEEACVLAQQQLRMARAEMTTARLGTTLALGHRPWGGPMSSSSSSSAAGAEEQQMQSMRMRATRLQEEIDEAMRGLEVVRGALVEERARAGEFCPTTSSSSSTAPSGVGGNALGTKASADVLAAWSQATHLHATPLSTPRRQSPLSSTRGQSLVSSPTFGVIWSARGSPPRSRMGGLAGLVMDTMDEPSDPDASVAVLAQRLLEDQHERELAELRASRLLELCSLEETCASFVSRVRSLQEALVDSRTSLGGGGSGVAWTSFAAAAGGGGGGSAALRREPQHEWLEQRLAREISRLERLENESATVHAAGASASASSAAAGDGGGTWGCCGVSVATPEAARSDQSLLLEMHVSLQETYGFLTQQHRQLAEALSERDRLQAELLEAFEHNSRHFAGLLPEPPGRRTASSTSPARFSSPLASRSALPRTAAPPPPVSSSPAAAPRSVARSAESPSASSGVGWIG